MAIATLLPMPRAVFYDARGNPLSGGLCYSYVPNAFPTPKQTWMDAAETLPNTNPIVLDADGSCLLYGSGSYTLIVTDALGNQIPAYSGLTTDTLSGAIAAFSPVVPNIAALRLATTTTLSQSSAYVLGYYSGHDGGEGMFVVGTTAADNGGTIIVDSSARTWYRETGGGPYSVKWFGATGNGSTDDYLAIQQTINYCTTAFVGPIFMPAGRYILTQEIMVTAQGLRIYGASDNQTLIEPSNTTPNLNLFSISGLGNQLENVLLNNPFFPTQPCGMLTLDGAVETKISAVLIQGGTSGIQILRGGADNILENLKVLNSYGGSQIYIEGSSGTYIDRAKVDQAWPKGSPITANLRGAWAPTTVYGGFDVVTVGGYYIQCMSGGTSGNLAPTLLPYNTNIFDGTVNWQLAGNAGLVGINVDTDSFFTSISRSDFTGAYRGGILVSHTQSGSPPQKVQIDSATEIGGCIEFGIRFDAGSGLSVCNTNIDNGIGVAAVGLFVNTGCSNINIHHNLIYGWETGIENAGDENIDINHNQVFGCRTVGIHVAMDTNKFSIIGNFAGISTVWGANLVGIEVAAGTSDEYIITLNHITGAGTGIIDGGTGVNKVVANNI